jgi:hypothetical protein
MTDLESPFHNHPQSKRFFKEGAPEAPPYDGAERVFFVPSSWHKDLLKYLSGTGQPPGSCWTGYDTLLHKRAEGLEYPDMKFGLVPYDLLPVCIRDYGSPPRDLIVRYWSQFPDGSVHFFLTAARVRFVAPARNDTDGVQFAEVSCFPRLPLSQVIPPEWALADASDGWRDLEVRDAVLRYPQPWRLMSLPK